MQSEWNANRSQKSESNYSILRWSADIDNKHIATVLISHVMKIWKFEFVEMKVLVKQVGPGYVLLFAESFFGPMVFLQTLTPVEPLVQKLSHYFYGPRSLAWLAKFTVVAESINVKFMDFLWFKINWELFLKVERDIMVWNHKTFVQNPLLPKEDKQIKLFRAWYGQFYTENSKSFSESKSNSLSW